MKNRILIIDDDPNVLKSLEKVLRLDGYHTESVSNPLLVEERLTKQTYNCVLLDVKMPGMNGLEILAKILSEPPYTPVIMISGQSNFETVVQAIKKGAFDFIEKPIDPDRLLVTIKNAIDKQNLQAENEYLSHELQENFRMIGKSRAMHNILDDIKSVASTEAKVLIYGETGTGKELIAWALHHNSNRKGKPYIKLNCASIPSELLESELFGHTKGAYTGAYTDHKGKFQMADGGTLFLDEIGDMDLNLQAKMLRALQEGEIEVIGERESRKVDVRIVSATNKNLEFLVQEGKFREDLYHRLNVVRISVPPLRERQEDILPLAYHFLKQNNEKYNRQVLTIHQQAESYLLNYSWPGNVRELQNVMEKLVIFAKSNKVTLNDIPKAFDTTKNFKTPFSVSEDDNHILELKEAVDKFKKQYIIHVLQKMNWRKNETAQALGIDRTNLFRKIKTLGLE